MIEALATRIDDSDNFSRAHPLYLFSVSLLPMYPKPRQSGTPKPPILMFAKIDGHL